MALPSPELLLKRHRHFSCAKKQATLPALRQQWPRVRMSDLALLRYTSTCILCLLMSPDRAESKARRAPLQYLQERAAACCTSCRRDPSLQCHAYVLAELLKICFPSVCSSVNWSAGSSYGKLILQKPWKSTFLTLQPEFRCLPYRTQLFQAPACEFAFHHSCVFLRPSGSWAVLYFVGLLRAKASVHKSLRIMFAH